MVGGKNGTMGNIRSSMRSPAKRIFSFGSEMIWSPGLWAVPKVWNSTCRPPRSREPCSPSYLSVPGTISVPLEQLSLRLPKPLSEHLQKLWASLNEVIILLPVRKIAAGSAVTAPPTSGDLPVRWEAGHVAISARYRQLLDAVLGPGANAPAAHPVSVPPDPRKWVRAMRAIESGIADGQWKPGDQLPARPALAQRYGLTVDAVMRAQDELLMAGALRRGQVYGALYISDAKDQQPPGAPLPAAPGPDDRGGCKAAVRPAGQSRGRRCRERGAPRSQPASIRTPGHPAARGSRGCREGARQGARPESGRCG